MHTTAPHTVPQDVNHAADFAGATHATRIEPMEPTKAERLRALEAELSATSTRYVAPNGAVTLALELENGDRIAGRGATTAEALAVLEARTAMLRGPEVTNG